MSEIVNNNPVEPAIEQPNAELEAEIAKLRDENERLRKATTNASADASKYKKELQARMTEDERTRVEREEQNKALMDELNALRREKNVSEHKASFIGLGLDDNMAQASAEAVVDGDYKAMFAGLRDFITKRDKAHTAEAFRNTPKPSAGDVANKTVTKEQFDKMGYKERSALYSENPELYKELTK